MKYGTARMQSTIAIVQVGPDLSLLLTGLELGSVGSDLELGSSVSESFFWSPFTVNCC